MAGRLWPAHAGVMHSDSTPALLRLGRSTWGRIGLVAVSLSALSFLPASCKEALHTRGPWHSWFHLVAFALATVLCLQTVNKPKVRLLVMIGAVLLGCGIEWTQSMVNRFPLETLDVISDTAGAILGVLVSAPVRHLATFLSGLAWPARQEH